MAILISTLSAQASTPIRFIYLNGSNANTATDKAAFSNGMKTTHEYIKSTLESSDFVKEKMLRNGEYSISDDSSVFFWGYESQNDLRNLNDCLFTMKMISPKLAQTTRSIISHCMHDAIWVQKTYNMQNVVNHLHDVIMSAYKKGEKVILSGHSAESFVTYEYIFHKLPCIKAEELIKKMNTTNKAFYGTHPTKPTCLDAITSSGLAVYSTDGEIMPNQCEEHLKKAYSNLDKYTDLVCTPQDEVLGVINFGSPLVLFYSDARNQNIMINRYNQKLFEYIQNNNLFFLTVNFADDPIGFPVSKNYSAKEMIEINNILFSNTSEGFIYNKSDVKSPAPFVTAHASYWKYPKKFAKAIRDAYIEGFKNFYPEL